MADNQGSKEPLKIAAWQWTEVRRNLDDGGGGGQRFKGTLMMVVAAD
jgi:hypothetical protein